jgi:serine phosphatase RsbU (regulator of sigma subunit)
MSLAAIELVADIVDLAAPLEVRRRLLIGIVRRLNMDGAALWGPGDRNEGWTLREHVGLPPDIVELVARWGPGAPPDRLMSGEGARDGVAWGHVAETWDGRTLYMVAIPDPAGEVLGVFARGAASDYVMRLIVALGKAYAAAVAQAEAMRHNQHVVDAMVAELRPTDVTLPGGYSVGHLYRSATTAVAIGGDLYDWFRTDRGAFGVAVGDVSGKGMQAASRTAMTVHSLRAFALPGASPHVAAKMLNTVVSGRVSSESFVTLIYVHVEPGSSDLGFVLAGHPPPIVMRRDAVEVLTAEADVPIGVDASATFHLHEATLSPGDSMVLYTDGVTEARAASDGSLLETAGLVRLLTDLRGGSAQQIADGVWQGVQDHTGGDTTDDVAVVVLQRGVSTWGSDAATPGSISR